MKESDVLAALEEADFDDLIPLLNKEMELAKEKKAKKAASKKEAKVAASDAQEQMET